MLARVLRGAVFCALVLPAAAPAQLAIDRLWVDFEQGSEARADIVIRNESKDRYYITVSPTEMVMPGGLGEKRVAIADPDKLGLLVTPNRLILEPGSLRSIRIVSLNGELTTDRVYRVKVTPQIGAIEAGDAGTGNRGVAIKVLAAYDLLVTVRPKDAKADVVTTRSPTDLLIRNAGNSNTLLFDGQSCPIGIKPPAPAKPVAKKLPDAPLTDLKATEASPPPSQAANSAGIADAAATVTASAEPVAASDVKLNPCEKIGSRRLYSGSEWKLPLKAPTDVLYFKERISASLEPKDVSF